MIEGSGPFKGGRTYTEPDVTLIRQLHDAKQSIA